MSCAASNQLTVLASRVRIMLENTLQGWVITFRDRNEINALTAQLSQVKRYVDNLRIMRHEQLNPDDSPSGLLHMGHYDEAIRYIPGPVGTCSGATGFYLLALPPRRRYAVCCSAKPPAPAKKAWR